MSLIFKKRFTLLIISVVFVGGLFSESPEEKSDFSRLEREVFEETNLLRTQPKVYAGVLQKRLAYFKGKQYRTPEMDYILMTNEGKKAVKEAIRACKKQKPLPALELSPGMSRGARDHVKDTGHSGLLGHSGSDGSNPFDRINRYGKWQHTAGENISYGIGDSGREVVIQLLVDDGVSHRGHRKNLFASDFHVTGVACGPHKKYGAMCVITYAGGYVENE